MRSPKVLTDLCCTFTTSIFRLIGDNERPLFRARSALIRAQIRGMRSRACFLPMWFGFASVVRFKGMKP